MDATTRAMQNVRDQTGRIDALLNIAGGFAWETIADGAIATWERMFTLNLKTTLTATKAALPHLIKAQGAIRQRRRGKCAEGRRRHGRLRRVEAWCTEAHRELAEEMKGRVRVNAVLPSILDTPQNRADMPQADFETWVQPADLATVILFLASDDARAVTGAFVPVTGKV